MNELVHLEQIVNQTDRDSWTLTDLNDLPETPPIEPVLGDTHLVYPGKRHVFSGPPESAKTLAAYCVLIQIARQGGSAILIDFEMGGYDARQRLRELGATHHEISRIAYLEPDEPATTTRIGSLVATRPDLVVIDASAGIYSLEGLDDNKRGDVEKVAALYVKLFWRNDIATILIDHVVKDGEARGRYAIGSERKLGGADVHLGFDTVKPISRGTAGQYKIVTHKDRGGYLKRGHLADLHLDSDPDTHQISWRVTDPETVVAKAGYFRPTHLMEKVSIDLEHRTEPVSRNTIYETVGGTKDYVLKAIHALVAEGFVVESDGDRRTKLVHLARHYRADNPVDNPDTGSTGSAVRQWFGSGSEPVNPESSGSARQFGTGSTEKPSDLAENPVVPNQFGSGSASDCSSGSAGGSVRSTEPAESSTSRPPKISGWFGSNGHLDDSDLAWLDELTPDHDPNADPNP